jgi:hypothetical protein
MKKVAAPVKKTEINACGLKATEFNYNTSLILDVTVLNRPDRIALTLMAYSEEVRIAGFLDFFHRPVF